MVIFPEDGPVKLREIGIPTMRKRRGGGISKMRKIA
jgi:hypothetical protein